MDTIFIENRQLNLPKLPHQGNESTIYVNNNKLYKIFNDDINLNIKRQSIEFVYKNKSNLVGLIMPEEQLVVNSFVGYTMDKYECNSVDQYFSISVPLLQRQHYCFDFLNIFTNMNNVGAEHMDFHSNNAFVTRDGGALIGDTCSIRHKRISTRFKREQLILLISLLAGYNLMKETNNEICINEIITQLGTDRLLNYYYKPDENLDRETLTGFNSDINTVKRIVKVYGNL